MCNLSSASAHLIGGTSYSKSDQPADLFIIRLILAGMVAFAARRRSEAICRRSRCKPLWLVVSVFMLWTIGTRADPPAAGTLDTTFGQGGIVITTIHGSTDVATSLALQSDGKIVAAGTSYNGANDDFAVVRYNTDGSLDTSFNGTGKVVTAIGSGNDKAYAVAVQTDGKIVVAGIWINSAVRAKIAVVRYNADGTLDTTFNGTGIVTTDNSVYNDFANGLVIQPDGKIVIGGFSQNPGEDDFELVRYNSDGSLDPDFNSTGIVKTDVGGNPYDYGFSVALQEDGKLVLSGISYADRCCTGDFTTARFNADGSFDTTFNGSGTVTTPTGSLYADSYYSLPIHGIALQSDGKIVVGGTSLAGSPDYDFTLVRYNSDGSLDTTFNATGKVVTTFDGQGGGSRGVVVQSDGKIVATGYAEYTFNGKVALVRYDLDGRLDTSFNGTGKVTTGIGDSSNGSAIALQSDGKIVVAGSTYSSSTSFFVARYEGRGPLTLTQALSRRNHASAGTFDIDLALSVAPAVECRSANGSYKLVFIFTNNVTSGNASVTTGTGIVSGSPTFAENTMTVNLTGVTDAQKITVTLSNVTDNFAQVLPDTAVSVNMLIGDTTGNKTVNSSDVAQTKAQSGSVVTNANFREDVTANGTINSSDVSLVKSKSGTGLP